MKIRINHTETEVTPGMTVMEAAARLGISIPSMCFLKGQKAHPSCMICMVEDHRSGDLFPSCAMPVSDGMDILTDSGKVLETRREALELLLSDHLGDCEAPCRLSCPAFMNIPLMNRLIAEGKMEEALVVVRQEIAIPLVLGYICPAPCEKACHRRGIDAPVSICRLKRASAEETDYFDHLPVSAHSNGKRIAIVGTGPAGLSAAFYLLKEGYSVNLYEKENRGGGKLYAVPSGYLPSGIIEKEIEMIRKMGGNLITGHEVLPSEYQDLLTRYDAVVLAQGHSPGMDAGNLPSGFFVSGNPEKQENMAVRSAAKGKETAQQVMEYLDGKTDPAFSRRSISKMSKLTPEEQHEYLKEPENLIRGKQENEFSAMAALCMHCDCRKSVSCKLRRYSAEYKADRKRFATPERKPLRKEMIPGKLVFEPQKCIRCGLCVDISSAEPDAHGMAYSGRGYHAEITPALISDLVNSLGNAMAKCVEACPTGALAAWKGDDDV